MKRSAKASPTARSPKFAAKVIRTARYTNEADVRAYVLQQGIKPVYKMVDTCAAEFEATTPYYYSTYETENEVIRDDERENHRARLRSDPDRSRHRVRLLDRSCGMGDPAKPAMKRLLSITTRRRYRPTSAHPTACTSSRCSSKTS